MAQTEPRIGEPERNLEASLARLREAAAAECSLLVLPECSLSGYMLGSEAEAAALAEAIPGPAVEALERECASLGIHCVVGLLERDGGALHNTAVLVGPDGLVGRHRKAHLPFLGVDRFTTPGDEAPHVFETPVGRIGIQICYELRFPEATRTLALQGADVLAHPTNWPEAAKPLADFLTRARAAENHVFLLSANRVGHERTAAFCGRSQVVDPLGARLAECDEREERLALVEIEPEQAREKHRVIVPGEYELHLFDDRRPELYGALVEEAQPVHAR